MTDGVSSANESQLRRMIPAGYAEHAPPADLAEHVACFWTAFRSNQAWSTATRAHRVLPDGCVDILLGFRPQRTGTDGAPAPVIEAVGVGTMTRPLIVTDQMPTLYVGVRFRPGHAFAALGIPAVEVTDEQVPYDMLSREAKAELEMLEMHATNEARLEGMMSLVRRRLRGAPPVPAAVAAAVDRISTANGNLRVASLADDIGLSRQQLARQFATHVGVAPKTFARVMRARAALARADAARAAYPREIDWSAIACALGYYDQPHFIDDFKALTGVTPSRWNG